METGAGPRANGTHTELQRFREVYDRAFQEWCSALKLNSGVPAAEHKYHESRDALFQFLMTARPNHHQAFNVERLAYFLWERAGRPHGTAESDWYKAEAILAAR